MGSFLVYYNQSTQTCSQYNQQRYTTHYILNSKYTTYRCTAVSHLASIKARTVHQLPQRHNSMKLVTEHDNNEGIDFDWDNDDLFDADHKVSDNVRSFIGLKQLEPIQVTKAA